MNGPESEIEAARQRVVRRNWRFSLVPMLILGVLLMVLAWEVARENKSAPQRWPWTIKLLGIPPAATLCGVFATLILAREQFARTMRPNLLWTSQFRESEILKRSAWTVHLMNVGPGLAHIESIRYSLVLSTTSGVSARNNLTHREASKFLTNVGLKAGHDYHLELITGGAPLSVVKQRSEGVEFASFTEEALTGFHTVTFSVVMVDTLGDRHKKSLPFIATLPDSLRNARSRRSVGAGKDPSTSNA